MPDTPTIFEWLALIQQDPAQARKLMITIKARDKIQGLFADPALTISVEEYDEAQRLLAAAAGDPAIARRAAHMARLGQATMGPSPDRAAWQALRQQLAYRDDVRRAQRRFRKHPDPYLTSLEQQLLQ